MKRAAKPRAHMTTKQMVLLAVVGLLLAGGGWLAYRAYAHAVWVDKTYAADKVRFAGAEQDLANAYAAIVKAAGKPYETVVSKGCGYGSVKYARGPLGCTIAYDFAYGTRQAVDNKLLGLVVVRSIEDQHNFQKASLQYGLSNIDMQNGVYVGSVDSSRGLGCDVRHLVYSKADYNSFGRKIYSFKERAITESMSVFSIECERDVPKALYPVEGS